MSSARPVDSSQDSASHGLPRVSVIVPVYNAAEILPTTAPSWLQQDHAELLIVDDGSTDESVALLEALSQASPSVRILKHGTNRGRAAARNTGIACASGDVLLFLDADMRPEPDFVRQHAQLHRNPDTIGVVSNPLLEGLDPDAPYHQYLATRREAARIGTGRPLPFKYFIIGYTSVNAHAVRTIGGFDERLSYGEDLDFAYRLSVKYPTGLRYSDLPLVHHYDHGTLEERLSKLREFGAYNLPLILAKHPEIAKAANIDFVDSAHINASIAARIKQWSLSQRVAESMLRVLPYAPASLKSIILRYSMAATIADAFRHAPESH